MTLPQMSLRFILSDPTVSTTIVGMRKLEHVRENIALSDQGALDGTLLAKLKPHRWTARFAPGRINIPIRQEVTHQNPYASFLGNRDAKTVIAETPGRLRDLAAKLGAQKIDQAPAPGKWSPREILCHLADCELMFAVRLRQTLAEPHHIIQPFEQDDWAKQYSAFGAEAALTVFYSVRQWNEALIGNTPAEAFSKKPSRIPSEAL